MPPSTIDGTVVQADTPITTPEELQAFELGSAPKQLVIDRDTGAVTSVTQISAAAANADPDAVSKPCATGAVCWQTERVPYADFGFSPKGTYTGRWEYRGTFRTHNYGGQAFYYLYAHPTDLQATPRVGKNTVISFSGSPCFGVRVVVS